MTRICFTGHRQIRNDDTLTMRLEETLRNLIEQHGATDFYSGGAIGWDTLCAETILKLRNAYPHIRLHLILPCCEAEQTASWNTVQKETYIISHFDDIDNKTSKVSTKFYRNFRQRLVEVL